MEGLGHECEAPVVGSVSLEEEADAGPSLCHVWTQRNPLVCGPGIARVSVTTWAPRLGPLASLLVAGFFVTTAKADRGGPGETHPRPLRGVLAPGPCRRLSPERDSLPGFSVGILGAVDFSGTPALHP